MPGPIAIAAGDVARRLGELAAIISGRHGDGVVLLPVLPEAAMLAADLEARLSVPVDREGLHVLFHLEPEIGMGRGVEKPDRIESEGTEFHAKVADAYLRIAEEHPERFLLVDSSRTADVVAKQVQEGLLRLLRPPDQAPQGER